MKHKQPGVTLIELLIVTVVIGILLGLTVFGIGNWRERTAISEVKNDLVNGATALQSHINFATSYPADQAAFEELYENSASVDLNYTLRGDGSYCLNAQSVARPNIQWKIDSSISTKDPSEGTCS